MNNTKMNKLDIDKQRQTEIEAQVFRDLVAHFRKETDVQNIDLMNLASFCRNCLAKWYLKAASDQGVDIDYDQARQEIYGMPYEQWKDKYQTPATQEQMDLYNQKHKK